jgi:hypothetical protein
MKLSSSSSSALAVLAVQCALVACSSSTSNSDAGTPPSAGEAGGNTVLPLLGRFTVLTKVANYEEDSPNQASTDVTGELDDGPTPYLEATIPVAAPADATPGCALHRVVPANCDAIGGCDINSQIPACAQAGVTGVRTCACVADNVCQPNPEKLNAGSVTITGVTTAAGATQYQLLNVGNAYVSANTPLAYPGMVEGAPITVSAKGGVHGDFEIASRGIAPVQLTNAPYRILKDPADPSKWQALKVDWNPPSSIDNAKIRLILDVSRHAGVVGYIICDVEDTGSLTISASLIDQLMDLGNIGGYPEINIIRSTTGTATVGPGKVELSVESRYERFPLIEGYTSCGIDTCPAPLVCNTGKKLCEMP